MTDQERRKHLEEIAEIQRRLFPTGVTNDRINVPTYAAYASGPEPIEKRQILRYFKCKKPSCDRFACTASAEWCSAFCCPGCASGHGHTAACDDYCAEMKGRLVPNAPVIDSETYGKQLRRQIGIDDNGNLLPRLEARP